MAEDDTPKRIEEDDDAPQIAVPSHSPLPPPPIVSYTRPTLTGRPASPRAGDSDASADPEQEGAAGHGAGLAAGFSFVASILAGLLAGTWLDAHFNHTRTPWWTMLMALAGTGVGFTNMFKLLSRGGRRKP